MAACALVCVCVLGMCVGGGAFVFVFFFFFVFDKQNNNNNKTTKQQQKTTTRRRREKKEIRKSCRGVMLVYCDRTHKGVSVAQQPKQASKAKQECLLFSLSPSPLVFLLVCLDCTSHKDERMSDAEAAYQDTVLTDRAASARELLLLLPLLEKVG